MAFRWCNSCTPTFALQLRKMCEYFADDKDGESLQQDWAKAEPSDKEAKQGWLAGWGSVVMRMVLPKRYRV